MHAPPDLRQLKPRSAIPAAAECRDVHTRNPSPLTRSCSGRGRLRWVEIEPMGVEATLDKNRQDGGARLVGECL